MNIRKFNRLFSQIMACQICKNALPQAPRPILQISPHSKVLVIGQAPGIKAHNTNMPFNDPSGDRLRDWMGVDKSVFYDADKISLMPMGFCFPGSTKTGDAPPMTQCAPAWHQSVKELMSIKCTILVGRYAQHYYLDKKRTLGDVVKEQPNASQNMWITPHPSGRNNIWLKKNPWFTAETLPQIRHAVATALTDY